MTKQEVDAIFVKRNALLTFQVQITKSLLNLTSEIDFS